MQNTNNSHSSSQEKITYLSVREYLWLRCSKSRLDWMNKEIIAMQYRQDRQAAWLLGLIAAVFILFVCVFVLAVF